MMTAYHLQRSRSERRMQMAAISTRTLVLAAALLTTSAVLGCGDSFPTASEEQETLEISASTTAGQANSATAGKPATSGIITRATFQGASVCGIPVTTEVFRAGGEWEPAFPDNPPLKETGTLRLTWTTADGKSLQLHASGNTTREITEWIDESTFRATETSIGLRNALKTPHGPVLSRDVGRIVVGFLVQLQEGGGFILLEPPVILEVSGPHPQAESNFTLFCEIVTDALS